MNQSHEELAKALDAFLAQHQSKQLFPPNGHAQVPFLYEHRHNLLLNAVLNAHTLRTLLTRIDKEPT